MLELVESLPSFAGFLLFTCAVFFFYYRISGKEGFGEFSVGISYRDLYAFLLVIVPITAAMAYLAMSMGLGTLVIGGGTVYWIRYFEWAITTPLLVLGVMVLTQKAEISVRLMVADFLMILTGFLGAVTFSTVSIAFFVLSSLFFGYILYGMLSYTEDVVVERPEPVSRIYRRLRNIILVVWSAYPFVYVLGNRGAGVLSFSQTNLVYLFLDLSAKIGFATVVLVSLDLVDDFELDMDFD